MPNKKETPTEGKIEPVKPLNFGLQTHRIAMFDAMVKQKMTEEELSDPRFWTFVAKQLSQGSEVRVVAEDFSFRALLICTYLNGTDARMSVIDYTDLDPVNYDEVAQESPYFIKQRGVKKWCILKKETGEIVKENIATQAKAYLELEEYVRALAA